MVHAASAIHLTAAAVSRFQETCRGPGEEAAPVACADNHFYAVAVPRDQAVVAGAPIVTRRRGARASANRPGPTSARAAARRQRAPRWAARVVGRAPRQRARSRRYAACRAVRRPGVLDARRLPGIGRLASNTRRRRTRRCRCHRVDAACNAGHTDSEHFVSGGVRSTDGIDQCVCGPSRTRAWRARHRGVSNRRTGVLPDVRHGDRERPALCSQRSRGRGTRRDTQ